ncbi:MAG TPA: hypothetical protein DEV98_01275 [Clostridiales bacterium]|nr:hypothetical protein [Clostridiales bacterium]
MRSTAPCLSTSRCGDWRSGKPSLKRPPAGRSNAIKFNESRNSTMSMYDRIKDVLVSKLQLNENEITPDSELVNDLGINSLELADLVMECEEEFDIEIDDNSIRGFVTVGDVAKYLESVVKEG